LNFIFVSVETREKKSTLFKINKTSAGKLCRIGLQKMLAKKFIQKKKHFAEIFQFVHILNLFFAEEKSTQKTSAMKTIHMNTPSDLPPQSNSKHPKPI
jgi:hypothetical protein